MSATSHGGLVYLHAPKPDGLRPHEVVELIKDLARAYASVTGCLPPQLSRRDLGLSRYVPTPAHVAASQAGSRKRR